MAEPKSNAPLRARTGTPTSGVIHVRTRLTADFAVIANSLAQRRGSAVTVGVAAYILSLPDGAPVRIDALCAHFTEGEILISRALRELEADGYLERRRERGPGGVIRTRTFFHNVPADRAGAQAGAEAPRPVGAPAPVPEAPAARPDAPSPSAARPEAGRPAPPPPAPDPAPDPRAAALLASLRLADRRLVLSRHEVDRLAPEVGRWLALGFGPEEITGHLTARLPDPLRARPARILAYRLRELPPALPEQPLATPPARPAVLPWQTCDGCERAFRAPLPGRCRDCPPTEAARGAALAAAC
ncbi:MULTISPECIES: hypothetical protein [unclassified Streptomyces]|uniref:hypothetical protein n=1 Tax=unclassified Streptomyces TaxID=2593676 RepID=UPI0037FD4281